MNITVKLDEGQSVTGDEFSKLIEHLVELTKKGYGVTLTEFTVTGYTAIPLTEVKIFKNIFYGKKETNEQQ